MSRFFIQSQLYHLPKALLQGSIKEWDLIDAHSIIAFDYTGNYVVWNLDESAPTYRGSVKACPKIIKTLRKGAVAYVVNDEVHVLDYLTGVNIKNLPIEAYKYVETIKPTKDGCLVLSTHSSNNKRLFVYEGGDSWSRIVELGNSTLIQFDFFEDNRLVKFQQSKRINQEDEFFKFSLLNPPEESAEKMVNCGANLKMTVMQILPIADNAYIILGNRLEGPETLAYTIQLQQTTANLSGPVVVSTNRLIEVIEFESHNLQVCLLTQLTTAEPRPYECVPGTDPALCICCIQCFDIRRQKVLSRLYVPDFNNSRRLIEGHMLALHHEEAKLVQDTPIRLIRLVHQNRLYYNMMKQLHIEDLYGPDALRRVIGFLDEPHH